MQYKDLVKDFTDRTICNLKTIEEMDRSGNKVFEVTQLINSLLGLLILPQQHLFDSIPKDSIEMAKSNGWVIPEPLESFKQVDDLRMYLRYLRNGISHFNIEFIARDEEICGITVWNKPPNNKINWKINLTIDEIKSITTKIKSLVNEYY